MNKTNESLSTALGVENKMEILAPISVEKPVVTFSNNDAEDDYVLARRTFRHLIEQGNLAMEDMKELARESESPRAFEVFSTMMKTISETTNDLFDLHKKTKELKEINTKSDSNSNSVTVEQAIFVGSTSDLLKKVKEAKHQK